jgi:carbonic anhydrase
MNVLRPETQATITPARALEMLKEGNSRFVNNMRVNRNLLQQATETQDGQWPFAAIVSCIDSRTTAEHIFEQGIGDIFCVRIAGNVINTDVMGSLEFACQIAGAKLIVVLGHSSCGAIKGACDHVELGNLTELLSKIQPAVYEESQTHDPSLRNSHNPTFVENVAELNVRRSVRTVLNRSYILQQLIESGNVAVIGGLHDLASGVVTFYDDTWVHDVDSMRAFTGRIAPGAAKAKAVAKRPARPTAPANGAPAASEPALAVPRVAAAARPVNRLVARSAVRPQRRMSTRAR